MVAGQIEGWMASGIPGFYIIYCVHISFYFMFSSQQTFTEHLLCTRYVVGAWGRGCGEQR